ncbi:MAG: mechanosensitive ion channel family protein, partial [Gaiellaceae bacterium]|nr:mechanosensitive ion channel family protein [Gaiellaceae bacterium]
YERRLAERDPAVAAARRTMYSFLVRILVVLVALVGVWSVLSIFPATTEVAHAFLASSAVLAVVAGLALTTPLGNLGAGVLLALTQPVRLGDRVTVGAHTGRVERITISYTALVSDNGSEIFVPNRAMVSETIVNRSGRDPRRLVSASVPVRLGASLTDARRLVERALERLPDASALTLSVRVGEVAERVVWLEVSGFAPPHSDVAEVASAIREHCLAALSDAGLLPA